MRSVLAAIFTMALSFPAIAQQTSTNPECKWSKAMRSDQNLVCPNDAQAPRVKPFDEAAYQRLKQDFDARSRESEEKKRADEEAFPLVDVDAWCAKMSPTPVCIRTQQRSYDYARFIWPTLSRGGRIKCAAMMREPAKTQYSVPPEYQRLVGCVDLQAAMDQAERDRVSPPRFRP